MRITVTDDISDLERRTWSFRADVTIDGELRLVLEAIEAGSRASRRHRFAVDAAWRRLPVCRNQAVPQLPDAIPDWVAVEARAQLVAHAARATIRTQW